MRPIVGGVIGASLLVSLYSADAQDGAGAQDVKPDAPYSNPFVVDGEVIVLSLQPGYWTLDVGGAPASKGAGRCISKEILSRLVTSFVQEKKVRDCRFARKQWKNGKLDLDMTCTDNKGQTSMKIIGDYSPSHVAVIAQETTTSRRSEEASQLSLKRLRDCQPGDLDTPL